jgi:hypothetical protein
VFGRISGGSGRGDGAGFPELAKGVNAEGLDFFGVAPGGVFNGLSAGIADKAAGKAKCDAAFYHQTIHEYERRPEKDQGN